MNAESDFDFALRVAYDHAASLPVAARIRVYRGVAIGIADVNQSAAMRGLASDLEKAELLHAELALQFKQPTNGRAPVKAASPLLTPDSVRPANLLPPSPSQSQNPTPAEAQRTPPVAAADVSPLPLPAGAPAADSAE